MYSTYFPPHYSGAAKQALSLAECLRERGHNIEFITVQWPGLAKSENYHGIPVHRIEMGRGKRHKEFRLWWNIFIFCLKRRRDFDIIHSHGAYYTNSIIGPLGVLFGWKSLIKGSLANDDLYGIRKSLSGWIHFLFLKTIDAYVAISSDLQQEFITAGLCKDKVCFWANGVDTKRFYPVDTERKKALRKELGLPKDRPLVLFVGVFDQRKNISWLLEEWVIHRGFESFAYLLAIGPQSRDDFNGDFLGSLKELENNNSDLFGIMDHVDNIETYYRAADLLVLPSTSEGMPNVVLEAMASGLPCVVSDISGSRELVRHGETGFLFEPGDVVSLQQGITEVLNSSESQMGRLGRSIIEKKYSITALAEKYERLYRQILHG